MYSLVFGNTNPNYRLKYEYKGRFELINLNNWV